MRTLDRYLKLRGKTYWYVRRVPASVQPVVGQAVIQESLRTRDKALAREARDRLARRHDREFALIREGRRERQDLGLVQRGAVERAEFASGRLDVTPMLDEITDRIDDLAARHAQGGDLEAARDYVLRHTPEGRDLSEQLRLYRGELTYTQAGELFLEFKTDLGSGSILEYRQAYRLAESALPPPGQVTARDVQLWINTLGETRSAPQIKKFLSGLRGSLKHNGFDVAPFRDVSVMSKVNRVERGIWSPEHLRMLLADDEPPWLSDAILIALYTGARQGAVAALRYDAENDWVIFPPQKQEQMERPLPCHSHIRDAVLRWVERPRAQGSVSNQFTKRKKRLGLEAGEGEPLRDFHSFRHQLASRMNDLGFPEHIAARITGHKDGSMVYGRYGSKGEVEALREWVEKIDWSDVLAR